MREYFPVRLWKKKSYRAGFQKKFFDSALLGFEETKKFYIGIIS